MSFLLRVVEGRLTGACKNNHPFVSCFFAEGKKSLDPIRKGMWPFLKRNKTMVVVASTGRDGNWGRGGGSPNSVSELLNMAACLRGWCPYNFATFPVESL